MTCCHEHNCRRRTPLILYRGDLTGQVYVATSGKLVRDHGDGTGTFAATVRHEVTEQMREFIRRNPDWVREVLEAAP